MIPIFSIEFFLIPAWLILVVPVVLWFVFYLYPMGQVWSRERAERFKHFKPSDWDEVDISVMESLAREDEMVRAFRRSGVGYRHR